MTDETIDFESFRRQKRRKYVNRVNIEGALELIESEIAEITSESHRIFGAVDPLAGEMAAYCNAIRRALPEDA